MGSDIINRVNILVKKTYYMYERFEVDATFALLYHEHPLMVEDLAKYVRTSDHLMRIDDNHYFIIFAFTPQANAYKASQNIVHHLDNHFHNHTSCIALDTFDSSKSSHSVFSRLQQILAETRKNPFVRIETEDILDR